MQPRPLKALVTTACAATLLIGCGGIGKMNKYVENIKYTVDPNPLIVQGDSVELNVRGNFPGKYFYKKATAELTPTLVSPTVRSFTVEKRCNRPLKIALKKRIAFFRRRG